MMMTAIFSLQEEEEAEEEELSKQDEQEVQGGVHIVRFSHKVEFGSHFIPHILWSALNLAAEP